MFVFTSMDNVCRICYIGKQYVYYYTGKEKTIYAYVHNIRHQIGVISPNKHYFTPSLSNPPGHHYLPCHLSQRPNKGSPGVPKLFIPPLPVPIMNLYTGWWSTSLHPLRAPINIGESAIRSESSTLWYLSHWWNIYTKPFKGFSPKPFPVTMFNLHFDTGIFDQYAMITIRNALSKYKICKQLW